MSEAQSPSLSEAQSPPISELPSPSATEPDQTASLVFRPSTGAAGSAASRPSVSSARSVAVTVSNYFSGPLNPQSLSFALSSINVGSVRLDLSSSS
jgi:hypothetical protein